MRPAIFLRVGALLLTFTACAEPDEPLAPLGELCGTLGPVRLLELAPDQAVIYRPDRIGERLFYRIGRPAPPPRPAAPYIPVTDMQLWTSGSCGEALARLDEQYSRVFEIERWPGLALACDHADHIVSLAATGPLAPNIVFAQTGCDPLWSDHGPIIPFNGQQLLLYPYPDDPRSETASAVVLPGFFQTPGSLPTIAAAGDDLLALRPTQELVSIDLRDNAVTLEQPGVGAFLASPSGRYFLWSPGKGPGPSPAILHDRETGQGVYLGDVRLSSNWQALNFAEQGLVPLYLTTGELRIYHLPDLKFIMLPPDQFLDYDRQGSFVGPLADGRWIFTTFQDSSFHTIDLTTGTVTPIFTRPGQVLGREPGGTLMLEVFRCCEGGRADDEGPVWFVPHDGSPPTRIADRSTLFGWRPRPDSLITLVDISIDRRARLVRVDTATQVEQLIDDHVFAAYIEDPSEPDIIRYSVQDGERSGVWQVRLPP